MTSEQGKSPAQKVGRHTSLAPGLVICLGGCRPGGFDEVVGIEEVLGAIELLWQGGWFKCYVWLLMIERREASPSSRRPPPLLV